MAMTYPWQRAPVDGDALDRLGGRHMNFQIADTVRVGTRSWPTPIQIDLKEGLFGAARKLLNSLSTTTSPLWRAKA